jgi:hypothetical protein
MTERSQVRPYERKADHDLVIEEMILQFTSQVEFVRSRRETNPDAEGSSSVQVSWRKALVEPLWKAGHPGGDWVIPFWTPEAEDASDSTKVQRDHIYPLRQTVGAAVASGDHGFLRQIVLTKTGLCVVTASQHPQLTKAPGYGPERYDAVGTRIINRSSAAPPWLEASEEAALRKRFLALEKESAEIARILGIRN